MKDTIIKDILNLKSGEQFSIGDYLKKYNISDSKESFNLCLEIVKELEDSIEPLLKEKEDLIPIVGLPKNIIYVRK